MVLEYRADGVHGYIDIVRTGDSAHLQMPVQGAVVASLSDPVRISGGTANGGPPGWGSEIRFLRGEHPYGSQGEDRRQFCDAIPGAH